MKKANSNNNLQSGSQSKNENKAKNEPTTDGQPTAQPPAAAPTDPVQKPEETGSNGVPTLPDQPIYAQGWIKYLHYDDAGKTKKKMFWKNTLFEQEQRMAASSADKSTPKSDEVILGLRNNFFIRIKRNINALAFIFSKKIFNYKIINNKD